jgi:hypothetical protein
MIMLRIFILRKNKKNIVEIEVAMLLQKLVFLYFGHNYGCRPQFKTCLWLYNYLHNGRVFYYAKSKMNFSCSINLSLNFK